MGLWNDNLDFYTTSKTNMDNDDTKQKYFNIYRISKLGEALALTLDPLVDNGRISNSIAFEIMEQFDKSMHEALINRTNAKAILRGRVKKYNHIQNIWIYDVREILLSIEIRENKIQREIYNMKVDNAR